MAGLDPAICRSLVELLPTSNNPVMSGWLYMMTNRRYGTLYLGVTGDLSRRLWEHREGVVEGFSRRYGPKRLVWAEHHDDIPSVIQREKNIKHWPRSWKIALIEAQNPEWEDLYQQLAGL
jgi:putative endonuclease